MLGKIKLFLLVLFYSFLGVFPYCDASVNIALHKPYTLSPKPNYKLSASPDDDWSLTDGKYTKGYFWTQKTTVGWRKSGSVEVCIDLGKEYDISGIVFSTARREEADVFYPGHVAAFIGADKDLFTYVGNIVDDPKNTKGSYQTKKFTLKNISVRGRYVFLVISPEGPHLFCDEIEVLKGEKKDSVAGTTLSLASSRKIADNLRRIALDKKFLEGFLLELKNDLGQQNQLKESISDIEQKLDSFNVEGDNLISLRAEMFRLRRELLRTRHPDGDFIVSSVDPWARIHSVHPDTNQIIDSLSLVMPVRGHDYSAFWVTNLSNKIRSLNIWVDGLSKEIFELSLYQAPFVKTASIDQVPDPLLTLDDGITLLPGESRLIFIKVKGGGSGTWKGSLLITSGRYQRQLSIDCQIVNICLPKQFSLNSVNWNYLNFKPTKGMKNEAMEDLFAHYTNVGVIHPSALPVRGKIGAFDISRLKEELEVQKGVEKILIMMNYRNEDLRTAGGKYSFMSELWKENFLEWYEQVIYVALKSGYSKEQVYLYPYDEMRGDEIDQFISFAKWLRGAKPDVRLYATLDNEASQKALPYLDIAQVINDHRLTNFDSRLVDQMWIYATKGPAKSLPPFSYYQKMAWQAFYEGFQGIGFWAYADTGWHSAPSSAWDDFDGMYPDYAVIYEGENEIISSRRWEAWMFGIEDFELLKMYSESKGLSAAKGLAHEVLERQDNPNFASEIRRRILLELSETEVVPILRPKGFSFSL